ncbi:ATP-binding protein [Corynebacterium kroppenstedtii]|uniref:Schlafen AlbA-2 domain-containing protein n=1 Tax=Corynebacterium kroppenstedtii (strain DSM 44385 / JCM 11950 / CIP 105744 / CCUG 35717) TaxID=645127 RepID=C4LGZ0_CORK4|nr:ATP-binding protein [Corynebacterium kroppenstedtii]ACR17095.1 hypothetical protein ckrop_0313 [Corynebacterium kroppenstedtii DSM 44385]QRP11386.1 ATP-binding protein [Corynebacterium kroppenstedtii]
MFTPIHRALGLEASDLSLDLIEQAVEHGVEESNDLDWKKTPYNVKHPKWDEEAAKDIAAMANSGGGWIVFGVDEDGTNNAASRINAVEWSADTQQRLLRTAYSKIGPPVLGLEFFEFPYRDGTRTGSVVIMRIPDSRDAPHFARKGDNAFVAPRRNGPHTEFMSDREIERGFRERFQYADDQERLLQDRFERACTALPPEKGVFLAVAAIPFEPVSERKPASQNDVYQYTLKPLIPELLRKGTGSWWEHGDVKKGTRQWVLRNDRRSSGAFRKYLYDDATVLGAYQLGLLRNGEKATSYYPVGLVNHCMSSHLESAVIDFITVLRTHAEERRSNGGFRIRAGLVGVDNGPIYIRTNQAMTRLLLDAEYVEPIVKFQPVTTVLDPLGDVHEMMPIVNDLARDLINQGGVQHLKVMAEPDV